MATATVRRSRSAKYAVNPDTKEVYEAVSSADWADKLGAWQSSIREIRSAGSNKFSALPSPMPEGHVMFIRRKGNEDRPRDAPPAPVWTDGKAALYVGQRICWQRMGNDWGYGEIIGCEVYNDGQTMITVRQSHGGVCALPVEQV